MSQRFAFALVSGCIAASILAFLGKHRIRGIAWFSAAVIFGIIGVFTPEPII